MIHTFSSTFSYVCSQIQPPCCIEEIYSERNNVGSYLDILKQLEPGTGYWWCFLSVLPVKQSM
jgi:hypothetical protein